MQKQLLKTRLCAFNRSNYPHAYNAAIEAALYELCAYELNVSSENASHVLDMIEAAENAFTCVGNADDFEIVFCGRDGENATPARAFTVNVLI